MSSRIRRISGISNLFFLDAMTQDTSISQLSSQFKHILRVTIQGTSRRLDDTLGCKTISFDQEPCMNLLSKVDEAVDFLRTVLQTTPHTSQNPSNKVLIVADSATVLEASYAILIAVAMQACQISYSKALQLLRFYFSDLQISPSIERQLRIWEFCEYSIFKNVSFASNGSIADTCLNMPGAFPQSSTSASATASRRNPDAADSIYKAAYIAWCKEHKSIAMAERIAIHKPKNANIAAHQEFKVSTASQHAGQQEISLPIGQHRSTRNWLRPSVHEQHNLQCHSVHSGLSEHLNVTIKLLS